jgi:hypothetical protein
MYGKCEVKSDRRDLVSAIAFVSVAYLATAVLGTWIAVRDGLVGRPFGWVIDMTPLSGFVFGLGTALSGPLVLLLALVAANLGLRQGERAERRAAVWIAILGAGFLAGMLAEPITWDVLEPEVGPLKAATVVANILLPLSMVILGIRIRGRTRRTDSRAEGPSK